MLTPPPWRLSLRSWIGLLALGLTLWLTITYATLLLEVMWLLFGALILSLAIRPLANALDRWRIPRGVAVLGVYAGLGGILALMGSLLVPVINAEVAHLKANGPTLLQEALSRVATIPVLKQWLSSTDVLVQNLSQRLDILVSTLVGAAAGVGGLALDLLVMLVLAYFFTTDVGLVERLVSKWVPKPYRPRAYVIMERLSQRLIHWVWAQVAIALYFAVAFSVGLRLLGVPFAFTIGLVGGVLEIVPYLGGMIAMLLAVLSALTVNPLLALGVGLFYLIVVEVESHVVSPAFYGRIMGLHPAFVLIALLIGAKIKGILGVLFAVPIAVVLAALLHEVQTTLISPEVEFTDQASMEE
jgi:predicted PurR-regulated permease PerM